MGTTGTTTCTAQHTMVQHDTAQHSLTRHGTACGGMHFSQAS
jgi:hypothetical protein